MYGENSEEIRLLMRAGITPLDDLGAWGDPQRVTHVWETGALVKGSTAR